MDQIWGQLLANSPLAIALIWLAKEYKGLVAQMQANHQINMQQLVETLKEVIHSEKD